MKQRETISLYEASREQVQVKHSIRPVMGNGGGIGMGERLGQAMNWEGYISHKYGKDND